MPTTHTTFTLDALKLLQLASLGMSLTCCLPQLLHLCRENSARGISLTSWITWFFISFAALLYAGWHAYTEHCCIPELCTILVNTVLSGCTLTLVLYYRSEEKKYTSEFLPSDEDDFFDETQDFSHTYIYPRSKHLKLLKGGLSQH